MARLKRVCNLGVEGNSGAGDRVKTGWEVYGRREERGREAGEIGRKYAILRNMSQWKKLKEAGANKYRVGTHGD